MIKCQGGACLKGCSSCQGYGHVLHQSHCTGCQRSYWVRPGVYTAYDGKLVTSFDGLALVWRSDGLFCFTCDDARGGKR